MTTGLQQTNCTPDTIIQSLSGKRLNDLGFFESCVRNDYYDYHIATIAITHPSRWPPIEFNPGKYRVPFIGVCAPKFCSEASILEFAEPYFDHPSPSPSQLQRLALKSPSEIQEKLFDTGTPTKLILIVVFMFMWMALIATFFNRLLKRRYGKKLLKRRGKKTLTDIGEKIQKRFGKNFFNQFDLSENYRKITEARYPSNPLNRALHLARGVAILVVFLQKGISDFYYESRLGLEQPGQANQELKEGLAYGLAQMGYYGLSFFFFLSGYASAIQLRLTKAQALKAEKKSFSVLIFVLFRRFFKIFPFVAIMLGLYWKVVPLVIYGPMYVDYAERCACGPLDVIKNLLFMVWSSCMEWTWYLGCDFQLFAILALLVSTIESLKIITLIAFLLVFASFGFLVFLLVNEQKSIFDLLFISEVSKISPFRLKMYFLGAIIGFLMSEVLLNHINREEEEIREEKSTSHQNKWDNLIKSMTENSNRRTKRLGGLGGKTATSMTGDFRDPKMTANDLLSEAMSSKRISSKKKVNKKWKKQRRRVFRRKFILLLLVLLSATTLALMFIFYHRAVQERLECTQNTINIRITLFVILSPIVVILALWALIYSLLQISKGVSRWSDKSILLNSISNLGFPIYVIYSVVAVPTFYNYSMQPSLHPFDLMAAFFRNMAITFVGAMIGQLLVLQPLKNCWKAYFDACYLEVIVDEEVYYQAENQDESSTLFRDQDESRSFRSRGYRK